MVISLMVSLIVDERSGTGRLREGASVRPLSDDAWWRHGHHFLLPALLRLFQSQKAAVALRFVVVMMWDFLVLVLSMKVSHPTIDRLITGSD